MKLEYLATETLMQIFEHLTTIDLLHAFHNLNSRFHTLLFKYFRGHNLDFRSLSKEKFDKYIQEYLPLIIDQIKSLYLSNNTETPGQIETFFSTYQQFSLPKFRYLKSLSISYLHSETLILKIINELSHLSLLTHLKFIECRFQFNQQNTQYILRQIFNQPKLIYCHLGIYFGPFRLTLPTSCVSSSSSSPLQQLRLVGWTNLNELNNLFYHLPHLQHLRLSFNDTSNNAILTNMISSMISLNILARNSLSTMINLLQNLPNLFQLKIETQSIEFDGYQWEYLISDHLLKLKIFQLKMLIPVNNQINKKQQVKDLLNSFQSHFWLKERQWFVRCHWNISPSCKTIYLYTLPYAFTNYDNIIGMKFQSTYPKKNDITYSYNRVHSLNFNNYISEDFSVDHIYFSRIRHLIIKFPINDYFYSFLPKLDSLISLDVSLFISNDFSSYLQVLFDQTPNLYALKISNALSIEEILTKNTSRSIRRLDFLSNSSPLDGPWFNDEQCISLIRSSLGIQCEVLLIRVINCDNILDLIHNMKNLRALNVQCGSACVKWLEDSLPKTYTIRQDENSKEIIRIWIGY